MHNILPEVFNEKIEIVRRNSIGVPRMMEIDLAIALIDHEYNISGNLFYIWLAPTQNDYINIKVNQTSQPAVPYRMGQGLVTPFDKLLITTPAAQTGNLYLMYGTEAPELLEIIDNRSALAGDISAMLEQLRGDTTPENWGEIGIGLAQGQLLAANANRKGCCICSDILNTGNIYLGFDNTVTTSAGGNNWFHVLVPGGSFHVDDYRGPIHAIATVAAQLVGTGEW